MMKTGLRIAYAKRAQGNGLREKNGGRYMDRTCDPHDVNVVLYR